jgi:hypothetical protein
MVDAQLLGLSRHGEAERSGADYKKVRLVAKCGRRPPSARFQR